tara:strand:+ start:51 stop:650 length:600 start_codon:yes stop_codon:yes gene_type:complete
MLAPFDAAWSVLKALPSQILEYKPEEGGMEGSSMFGMTMHPAIQGMVERARQQGDFSKKNVTSANQEQAMEDALRRTKQRDVEGFGVFGDARLDDFHQQHIRPSSLNPYDERDMERGQMPKNTGMQTQGLAPSFNMGMGNVQDMAQQPPVGSQQYNLEQGQRMGIMQPTGGNLQSNIGLQAPASLAFSPTEYRGVMGSM